MTETPENTAPTSISCPASKDPAVRTFIMAAMLLGIGIWCWMDAATGKYPPPAAWNLDNINEAAGYAFNHFTPWIAIPIGLILGLRGFLALRRVLTADAEGMGYEGKDKLPWEKITALDASRLKSKGILEVTYADGEKLLLDSWKLQNFRDLVGFVESRSPVTPTTAKK
ncbi:MAG: hypothetical protein QGG42_08275 [Phycisphaerae bacterium]|jgi:hypothetical protein|nr:hypothetical protein [Phycisphaerae bacterium]